MLHVILLAGGQSRRMRSQIPKVLHPVGGKPLLAHLVETTLKLNPDALSIVYGNAQVPKQIGHLESVHWMLQTPSLGTGHAVAQVLPHLSDDARVLILPGDTPLISHNTLAAFIRETSAQTVGVATAKVTNPSGLGRIIRDPHHQVLAIVEEEDADPIQRQLHEVNVGIYLVSATRLKRWIPRLSNQNAQGEYYLTDMIASAVKDAIPVTPFTLPNTEEIQGVNTRFELSLVEQTYQRIQARHLLQQGLGLRDPQHFWLYGTLKFGQDVAISHNVTLEGEVQLGDNVSIGPYSLLHNVTVGANVVIEGPCIIKETTIQQDSKIGPFAHIHNQVTLMRNTIIGNFVEVTRSQIGSGSKIKHLSYMGDVVMGEKVNVGAGTITCNFDGVKKHGTQIGSESRLGAQTTLIAPVTIGSKATIGAGSVITQAAPANQLTLSRTKQITVDGWKRPEDREKRRD
jgi:bifunctional UDP-N-acetylglucosamine pyrophosphorylase / glucosamine-1-phosphate N-acetyltransferase